MLNYDSLLNIFHHYRLEDVDRWNLRLAWCKLAHVCRRWRYLIYDSSSLLDMYLFLTNGSPILDSLAHLPPLPLVIDYRNMATTRVRQDELSILTGLQQRARARRIFLQVPSQHLGIYLAMINDLYLILEDLSLSSTSVEETSLVLPSTFSAPNLRYLELQGVGFPTELPLFTHFTTLTTLTLTRIPAPCYFHPGHLVTQLQGLLYLEELSIGFAVPIPLPSAEGELLPAPIPQVTLPTLKRLMFRGVAVYLENLIAQINAPLLERLIVTLFFEIAFTLVSLTQFIHTTGGLRCLSAKVLFKRQGASIVTDNGEYPSSGGLTININCEHLDWQIDAATQCCRALGQALSVIEDLTLNLDEDGMPSDWGDSVDSILWHGLLLPFSSVKKLQIGSSLTFGLSDALKPDAAELDLNLLPELQKLEIQPDVNDANRAFSTFIRTRELEGRPVELLVPRLPSQTEAHVRPMEEHVHLEEEHVGPIEDHVRPIEDHVRPTEDHVRPIEGYVPQLSTSTSHRPFVPTLPLSNSSFMGVVSSTFKKNPATVTSSSSPFALLLNAALHDYAKQTGKKLENHPLTKKLKTCDSVDSIASVLQDYQEHAKGFRKFQGDKGKIMRPMKRAVYVLFTLSSRTFLGEVDALVCPSSSPPHLRPDVHFIATPTSKSGTRCLWNLAWCRSFITQAHISL